MDPLGVSLQWRKHVCYSAQHSQLGVFEELDCGVIVCFAKSPLRFMNCFFLSSPIVDEADLSRRLEGIKSYADKLQPSFKWLLCIEPELIPADLREQLQNLCSSAGFQHARRVNTMQTSNLLPPVRSLPEAEVKFADSRQEVRDSILLIAQAYKTDTSTADETMFEQTLFTDLNKEFCCLVTVDGKLVATTVTALLDDSIYVSNVATAAEYRNRGYAELAMRTCIERCLEVLPNSKYGIVLVASDIGRPVYQRMGFKDISYLDIYVSKAT